MTTRSQIVSEARTWLDVNYKRKGRTLTGIDCVGLPLNVANALALIDFDSLEYPDRPDGSFIKRIAEVIVQHGGFAKPIAQQKDGDLLVFATEGHPCHCGIRATEPRFNVPSVIHAHARRRKVVEETLEAAASICGKPIACFQLPGVEE